jgi:hypothetical protein
MNNITQGDASRPSQRALVSEAFIASVAAGEIQCISSNTKDRKGVKKEVKREVRREVQREVERELAPFTMSGIDLVEMANDAAVFVREYGACVSLHSSPVSGFRGR